jgi:AcrR family transcriptional regulator
MMTLVERRDREKVGIRDLILEAARELFVEQGYEGVSMRKVAQRIDYSPTAIYLHFADKESLFKELCGRDFAQLAAVFRQLSTITDPKERLTACGRAYIEFAVAHPNHYRLMFMTPVNLPPSPEELKQRGNPDQDAYAFVRSLLVECLREGLFRPELKDAELLAQTIWAAVHGVAALEITQCSQGGMDWRSLRDRSDLMLEGIMHGLARDPAPTNDLSATADHCALERREVY